ncbi:MAG: HD-GYP domain-containing protein [Myxococcota bacterium]
MSSETVREFLRACTRPYSLNPLRNGYVVFGVLWGLGLPAILLLHHLSHNDAGLGLEHVIDGMLGSGIDHFMFGFPLLLGWVFGTLGTIRRDKTLARRRTIDLLEEEVAARTQGLRDAYVQTVLALSAAIEAKHPYTHGHCRRVWGYARAAAIRLGVPERDLDVLRFAAYLHDIGKLRIPDAVLDKPGRLTDEEYDLVKKHPSYGAAILRPISGFEQVASLVRMHHEREDGSGYPDGLTGDRIPLLAKILAVADTLDAMVSTRPYRPPLSMDEAFAELRRCANLPFDASLLSGRRTEPCDWFEPRVVEAMEVAAMEDLAGDPDSRPLSRPVVADGAEARVIRLRRDTLRPLSGNGDDRLACAHEAAGEDGAAEDCAVEERQANG